jgi:hypothetical protein
LESWRLGICVPEELLGCGGYLPSKQPQLEELTLVTNNQCEPVNYDLSGFANLKALSWTGLRDEDIGALMSCFELTSQQLKTIELDFWTSGNMGEITRPVYVNYFAEGSLQVNEGDEKLIFPVIEIERCIPRVCAMGFRKERLSIVAAACVWRSVLRGTEAFEIRRVPVSRLYS